MGLFYFPRIIDKNAFLCYIARLFYYPMTMKNRVFTLILGSLAAMAVLLYCPKPAMAETAIDPNLTYLIITRPVFKNTLTDFVEFKTSKGETVGLFMIEDIVAEYDGADAPEKIRNFLRDAKNTAPRAKFVLLVGAPRDTKFGAEAVTELKTDFEVPIRYVGYAGVYDGPKLPIPTDQYYASVLTEWNPGADFSFTPDFFVGRVPAKTADEVAAWSAKTIAWNTPSAPRHSQFISSYCGRRTDPIFSDSLLGRLTHKFIFHYCTTDEGGDIAELANLDQADYVSSYSHGAPGAIVKPENKAGYTLTKASPGFTKNPVVFVHGCEVGGLDYPQQSLGENLILRPDGAAAFVGSSRSHWDIRFPFWQAIFLDGHLTAGEALYRAKQDKVATEFPSLREIDNLFMFNLLGDPGLKVVHPSFVVTNQDAAWNTVDMIRGNVRRVHTVVTSLFPELVAGHVGQQLQYSTQEQPLEVEPGTVVKAVTDIGMPQTTGALAQTTAVGFSGCDPDKMSCIAAEVKLTAPLNFSCGRKTETADGRKAFQIKFWNYQGGRVSLHLIGKGGMVPTGKQWSELEWQPIADGSVVEPTAGLVAPFAFDKTMDNLALAAESADKTYFTPSYQVWAEDENGNYLGKCAVPNLGEPNVF
jgi:hypothetical protein